MSHRQSSRLKGSWGPGVSCASTLGSMRSPRRGGCTTRSCSACASRGTWTSWSMCLGSSGRLGERGDRCRWSLQRPSCSFSQCHSSRSAGVRSSSSWGDLQCHRRTRVRGAQRAWHRGQRRPKSQAQHRLHSSSRHRWHRPQHHHPLQPQHLSLVRAPGHQTLFHHDAA